MWDAVREILGSLLAFFYDIVPNFGLSIILLTILVNFIVFPLTLKQTLRHPKPVSQTRENQRLPTRKISLTTGTHLRRRSGAVAIDASPACSVSFARNGPKVPSAIKRISG